MVLMWALNMIEEMPYYDTESERSLLRKIPSTYTPEFAASAALRSDDEISRARDIAQSWHWRSRTRRLMEEGREFPADERMAAAGIRTFDDVVRFTAREGHKIGDWPEPIDGGLPGDGESLSGPG